MSLPRTMLSQYLGDSASHAIPLRWGGLPFSPGVDWSLIWTVKADENADGDTAALIQKASGTGITTAAAVATVTTVPDDTVSQAAGELKWDIQAQHVTTGEVRTVAAGILRLRRDVTREITTSIPIYTTEPPYPGGGGAGVWGGITGDIADQADLQAELDAIVSGGVPDGDKGDVVVAGSSTVWTVPDLPLKANLAGGNTLTGAQVFSHTSGPVIDVQRTTSGTNNIAVTAEMTAVSTGDAADGFGPVLTCRLSDTGVSDALIGSFGFVRAGADNTGEFVVRPQVAGSATERFRVTSDGMLVMGSATVSFPATGAHSGTNTGDQTSVTGNAGTVTTINGRISAGTNVTLTGTGTAADPYVIASSGGASGVTVQDEGTPLSTSGTTLNFVGDAVAATGGGAVKTITINHQSLAAYAPLASPTFTGTVSGITKTMVGLGSVENTALSTWAGTSNVTTLGTITTGTWQGAVIAPAYLGTGASISTKYLRGDGTWQTLSGGGDAATSGTLDQFADVTQTAGQTLAITASTTLSGGTHSGTNTGDNAVNSNYSGLVSNATHTGDATGATVLTLATVNSNVGSFGSATQSVALTVNGKGLVTAASASTITPAVGSITGLGTGIATALAVNTGSAGAPVLFNGALGTPSSGTLTNATGLPVSTGVSGLGTGVATALAIALNAAGGPLSSGYMTPQTLTSGTSISFDAASGTQAKLTLAHNATLGAPSNLADGQTASISGIQDGTGGRSLALNAAYLVRSGALADITALAAGAAFDLQIKRVGSIYRVWITA